ncbi:hypothetical protein MPTK1_7g13700 [Marchantia polymorpha subsp. ruderalis]|uniref:Uncharacterized protein n=2 Tax=Marchantia polymorpha TaxID=3197 RepID=A0AAF6BZ98_MARPO|nr:hypothetical protein MARPO_0009s0055 [Marchantia polymorpha]BBN17332.1 hypothetical protein Mp_7g13700 [Marchantia polymorpha subsp. ruderalis]|eukprot:PTQ46936.1 hypothetical protein MARPO_0009s0055 [Marchantia polymorpha]
MQTGIGQDLLLHINSVHSRCHDATSDEDLLPPNHCRPVTGVEVFLYSVCDSRRIHQLVHHVHILRVGRLVVLQKKQRPGICLKVCERKSKLPV